MARSSRQLNFNSVDPSPPFSDLWLPFEAQIQRLCASERAIPDQWLRQGETRRWLVERLFQSREEGDPAAREAVEAFSTVLRLYVDETQRRLEKGGYSQREAEATALETLSHEAAFLQKANAYAGAYQTWLIDLLERGELLPETSCEGLEESKASQDEPRVAGDYVVQTSQESAILLMSICDGKSGKDWHNDGQAGTRTYERHGLPHLVQLRLSEEERIAGLDSAALEEMTRDLDADGTFAVLYVSRLLAPPTPLPRNALAYDWVDLNDIIKRIGWDPRSASERQEMRRRVWNYLRFCARANIMGQRSGTYHDPNTEQEISTRIDGPIWRFMKEERPIQPSLFEEDDVPVRVQIAVSPEWTRLTTSPFLAQFLPMGEILGAIPPDKPSGAWARCIGLAISGFWRRQPRAALDGSIRPTRRELLTGYAPKVTPPEDVLTGKNPRRAIEYWHGAVQILVESGFISRREDAVTTLQEAGVKLPRKGWQEIWMEERLWLYPGPQMEEAVRRCAENLPILKPRNLKTLPRKRGRPKKTSS